LEKRGESIRPDDDRLTLLAAAHALVGPVGDGVDVGRLLSEGLTKVLLDLLVTVKRELLVRVDGDENEGGVGVDLPPEVAVLDVVEEVGVVEVHQLGVIRHAIKVGRVRGEHLGLGHRLGLVLVIKDHHFALLLIDLLNGAALGDPDKNPIHSQSTLSIPPQLLQLKKLSLF